ncbi:hypothetical protein IJT17_09255 [bacterium]|nr:hypothetical protein [bacterium]
MLSLRKELTARIRRAVTAAQNDRLWSADLQPSSFEVISAPHSAGGDVSWPGLLALPIGREARPRLAELLRTYMQITPACFYSWAGLQAGFVNFSWSEAGWEHLLRRAAAREMPDGTVTIWQGQESLKAIGAVSHSQARELTYAIQRTLWLEKMACDQRGQECIASSTDEVWAASLTSPEERSILRLTEYLPWTCAKTAQTNRPQAAMAQAVRLARAWGEYYERFKLLKGTEAQIRARIALGKAVRAALSPLALA